MEKAPNQENIEGQIEQLLAELDKFVLDQFEPEIQDELADEWYEVEMAARVGMDRESALSDLQKFVKKISNLPKSEG